MVWPVRRAQAAISGALFVAAVLPGCASPARESGAVGTVGESRPAIAIDTSARSVTVENRSGAPLVDVQVVLNPVGSVPPFTTVIPRLEPGAVRSVALGEFRNENGRALNPMFVRPKNVVASAADTFGKRYQTTAPWAE